MANGETPDPKKQKAFNQEQKQTIQNQKELNTEGAAFQELLDKFSEKHTGINKSIQGYLSSQEDITGQLQQQLKNIEGNKEGLKGSIQLSRQVTNAIKNSIGPYNDIKKIQKEQEKNLQLEAKLKMQSNKLFEEAGKSQGDYVKEMNAIISNEQERTKIANELQGIQDKELGLISDIRSAQQAGNIEAANSLSEELSLTNEKGTILSSELGTLQEKRSSLQDITTQEAQENLLLIETQANLEGANQKLDEQLQKQQAVNKAMGLTGGALKTVNKLLGGALGNTDEILKNSEEQVKALIEQRTTYDEMGNVIETGAVSKMEGFGIQIGEVGKQIKGNLSDPLLYLKIGLDFNKQVTEIQKNLGVSRGEAAAMRHEFSIMAGTSGTMAINSKEISEAFAALNEQFGTASTALRDDIVVEAAELMKLTGQSAESVASFAKFANISGKPMATITKEARAAVVAAEKEGGVRLNINKVLEETGKVGGQISAQLGGNPAKIAKAVALAKQFGMELEQVANTAKSLLDFESSIESELEAELLTGKQLNLEKARLAALTGDYETLTEEINKNVGDFGDFSKMNVLQQDALAKSLGMTTDQLSEQLLQKANLEELAQEARAGGDEELAQQLERRSAEEKFQDAVVKLKGIFADLVGGPVSAFLNILTLALEPINYIVTSFTKMIDVFRGGNSELTIMESIVAGIAGAYVLIKGTMMVMKGLQVAGNVLAGIRYGIQLATNKAKAQENKTVMVGLGRSVAVMVAKFIGGFAKDPITAIIGTVLALALAGTVFAMSKKTGDLAAKGTGGPMVMTSPQEGGLYQGTSNDQVLMSPTAVDDAMKPKTQQITALAPPPPPPPANNAMNEKMDALIAATKDQKQVQIKSVTSSDLWDDGNPNAKGTYQKGVLNETEFA
tara:strand:+ start:1263 stop:3971 length:2709 start_codon:yes stop_codon:yes gene_type:complete